MKNLQCWRDLEPFGVIYLTGEACGLSYRLLCDVTEKGRTLLSKAFGIPAMTLAEAWNAGSEQDPHVGSLLLVPDLLLPLGVFALLENGCTEVWVRKNGALLGIEESDSSAVVKDMEAFVRRDIVRKLSYRGTARDRNVHEITGRTV